MISMESSQRSESSVAGRRGIFRPIRRARRRYATLLRAARPKARALDRSPRLAALVEPAGRETTDRGEPMGDRIDFNAPVNIERMHVYMEGEPMENQADRADAATGAEPDIDHLIRCAESIEALGDIIAEIGDNPRGDAMKLHAERIGWLIAQQARPIADFLRDYYPAIKAGIKSPVGWTEG